jgi:hypothetical protein
MEHFVMACNNQPCPLDFEIPSVNGLSRKGGASKCREKGFQPCPASLSPAAIKWLTDG